MNKKFTFMVAALLAAGGFASNAFAQTNALTKDFSSSTYYLIGDGTNGFLKATTITANDDKEYTILDETGYTTTTLASASAEDAAKALWKVEPIVFQGKIQGYKLYNKGTEGYLTLVDGTTMPTDDGAAPTITDFTWFLDSKDGRNGKLDDEEIKATAIKMGTTNGIAITTSAATSLSGSPTNLNLYVIDSKNQTNENGAKTLNETMAGDGLSFAPADDDVEVDPENNAFSQPVKAFFVAETKDTDSGETIPAGIYFATSYPEELEGAVNKIHGTDNAATIALFESCTFIAVSPNENYGTSSVSQNGLELITVKGEDLVKVEQKGDDVTKEDAVWVGNAAFRVTENNPYANPGEYTLKLEKIRYQSKSDGTHAEAKNVNIGVTTISNVNYVTTTADATAFKTTDSSIAKAADFVAEGRTPSIYNIQFVSGEGKNSENGKYLGVGIKLGSSFQFVAQGSDLVNLEAPQYRFVVSKINTTTQEITFLNLETEEELEVKLYEVSDDVYRIKGTSENVQIANEDKVAAANYTQGALLDMEIKLIPVSEEKPMAGFLVKEINNNEPVKLSFATTETSNNRVYVAVDPDDDSKTILTDDESAALQVVFEPVLDRDGSIEENEFDDVYYAYKTEDGYARRATASFGKYYKYNLRVVGTENEYIKENSNTWEIETVSNTPTTSYIAKLNPEGSVSLVSSLSETANEVTANDDLDAIETNTKLAYWVPNSDADVSTSTNVSEAVSLFMEVEELGLSLPAEPVHVSLEAQNGGFVNVNEANEGVVAIRTEAAEDLTFWLDTTDSKALIPSFYISKGSKFMYNSKDSLDAVKAGEVNPYKVTVNNSVSAAKAIFKAGTLVDSETLTTTVDKKEKTVKVEADQNKGILGGLKNFQYNIVKPNDTEDNYVIRSAKDMKYVTSVNGVLAFVSDKASAMRVIVETQSAPTSNESVSASEVAVVAQNGSVVVKNAAGKNVVVSTILGQVVANEVLTSDNATINVPAGIVVVAVEGESFKVNVK